VLGGDGGGRGRGVAQSAHPYLVVDTMLPLETVGEQVIRWLAEQDRAAAR
jgi:hypothetical protein